MKKLFLLGMQVLAASGSTQAAEGYLALLQNAVAEIRTNLTNRTQSAERAAAQFLAGGNLLVAGRQADFIAEACGRAGGLMAIASLGQRAPTNRDIILYAVPGAMGGEDANRLGEWQMNGVTVIKFSSTAGLYHGRFPVDTVANIVDLWVWTGEFVAACTRLGRMPVLYQSYGLPGGVERGKQYQGKRFHDDVTIQPLGGGVLGRQYLGQIQKMLGHLGETQSPKLRQGARWWDAAASSAVLVTGHIFPQHAQDPRAPSLGRIVPVPAWEDRDLLEPGSAPGFVLYLGYQFAPRKLLGQAKALGVKLVYSDVEPGQPPEPASNIVYIDPGWPLADGCVTVPGYDVPILPASGVMQAAIC